MPMTEDLSVFFDTDEFADAATLDGAAVAGIYHDGYDEVYGMATHDAWYRLPEADTTATTQASVLVVRGLTYRVRVVKPDGTGLCTLLLEAQA